MKGSVVRRSGSRNNGGEGGKVDQGIMEGREKKWIEE